MTPKPPMPITRRAALAGAALPLALGAAPAWTQARAQPAAQRIVAAGGVITEIVYALGLDDQLVGVDTTSLHPPQAMKDKAQVGYVRQLSAEGILSLRPTLVIAIEGAGPPDTLKLVAEAGIRIERIPEDLTPKGICERVRVIGRILGAEARAEELATSLEKRFAELDQERAGLAQKKRVLFVLSLQNGRVMVGGRHSSADAIIALAGGVNAAESVEGYKTLTDEGIIAAAPDVVLVMRRAGQEIAADQVFAMPAFSATPAARAKALVAMDGLYLLGFGPRTPEAAHDLMVATYGTAAVRR